MTNSSSLNKTVGESPSANSSKNINQGIRHEIVRAKLIIIDLKKHKLRNPL